MEMGSEKREAGSTLAHKPIQDYRDIEANQRAKGLLAPVHALVRRLPREEQYELASQIRRASKSILANIAEGYGNKRSPAKFRSFLDIALGSANEMIVHLEVGHAIGYFEQEEIDPLIEQYEIAAKQLYRLVQSWQDVHEQQDWCSRVTRSRFPFLTSRFQFRGGIDDHHVHERAVAQPHI